MAGIYDFIREEYDKAKKAFGLIGGIKVENDPMAKELSDFERKLYEKSLIYKSMKDAVTAPARAYRGEFDVNSPYAVQEAMNTAGMAQLGGIPGGAKGPGSVGMSVGPKSLPPAAPMRPRNALGQEIPPTQYELAHEVAQRNAALPVEQGGLGLPAGNTAMDRARAMGFDTDAYHGTANNVPEFKNSELGKTTRAKSASKHHFFAQSPWSANSYTWTNLYEGVPEKYVIHTSLGRMLDKSTPKKYIDLIDDRAEAMEKARSEAKNNFFDMFESYNPINRKKWTDSRGFNFSESSVNMQGIKDFANSYGLPYINDPVEFSKSIAGPIRTFSDTDNIMHLRDELAEQTGASAAAIALGKSPNVMPVMLNTGNTKTTSGAFITGNNWEGLLSNILRNNKSYDTVKITDITDGGPKTTHYAIKDPTRIRSRFAAFDPMKRNSADLLAGLAAPLTTSALLAALLAKPEEAQAK